MGKFEKANSPALELTVFDSALVADSTAVTSAPATTAPDSSVTVPLIPPRKVCPTANPGRANNIARVRSRFAGIFRPIECTIASDLQVSHAILLPMEWCKQHKLSALASLLRYSLSRTASEPGNSIGN